MENISPAIDKLIDYFQSFFRQKLLFFLIFLAVSIGIYFNLNRFNTVYYGELDVYVGGDYYYSKLNSIQEKIDPLSRLKIDFLTNANIGFGIKESKFVEQQESIILLDNIKTKSSIFVEEKSDIFKNQLNKSRIFSKYLAMAKRKQNQLHFINTLTENAEFLKKYGFSEDTEIFFDFKNFHLTYYYDSPSALVTKTIYPEFRRIRIGFQSYNKKYILPVLAEYNKYLNNIINQDIEATLNSFIDSNKQMISFQQELLNDQLEILKENYEVLMQDEISKLQENLLIAKALGYKKNYFFFNTPDEKFFQYVSYCDQELYCMGYEAIQQQIDSMLNRNDSIPYIKGYREIQSALKQLEVVSIASIAESLTSEYNFKEYKDYVRFDPFSIEYKSSNDSTKFNVTLVVFGILLFLFIALINKIYRDEKKLLTNQPTTKL